MTLKEFIRDNPDRKLILMWFEDEELQINILCTVVDGAKAKLHFNNFGEFFNDQVKEASTIVVSRVDKINEEKLHEGAITEEELLNILKSIQKSL